MAAVSQRPATASTLTLEHPQVGLRLEERLAAWRIEPTNDDLPAGVKLVDNRPTFESGSFNLLEWEEPPPAPPRQKAKLMAKQRRSVQDNPRRPPSAPHQMLVGTPRPGSAQPAPRPQTASRPTTAASAFSGRSGFGDGIGGIRPPTSSSAARPPTARLVPSRVTGHSSAHALRRDGSINYVHVNARNAAYTPRRQQTGKWH